MNTLELSLLNKAISMAQTDPRVAFAYFEKLHESHPNDLNILLWLFHTAPAPTDIEIKHLDKLKELDPHNPIINQVEQKMRQQIADSSHLSNFFPNGGLSNFVIFLLATIILTGAATYLITYIVSYKLNTVEATGTTIGFIKVNGNGSRRNTLTYYSPQIQFLTQDRQSYKATLLLNLNKPPQNGTTFTLYYHRNNPNQVSADSFPDTTPGAVVVTILALLCGIATLQILSKARKQRQQYTQRFGNQSPKEPSCKI